MGRTYEQQKLIEEQLIRGILGELGYDILSVRLDENPDAIVEVRSDAGSRCLGIEHTSYFNDTIAGEASPTSAINELWNAVQSSLMRRICRRQILKAFGVTLRFGRNPSIPKDWNQQQPLARQLASELVQLMLDNAAAGSEDQHYTKRDLTTGSMLQRFAEWLRVYRWTEKSDATSRLWWVCSNLTTGHVGVSLKYLASAVENKNRKAVSYAWLERCEKWLLVAAAGDVVSNHAGPVRQHVDWNDASLRTACGQSPFSKILFWEPSRCWYKWLKPRGRVKQYRNPYISCRPDDDVD